MGVRRVSASAAMLGAVLAAVSFVRVCHIMDIVKKEKKWSIFSRREEAREIAITVLLPLSQRRSPGLGVNSHQPPRTFQGTTGASQALLGTSELRKIQQGPTLGRLVTTPRACAYEAT